MQIHRWRAGLQAISALLVTTLLSQDAPTLAIAGFLFIVLSKFLPYILWGVAIVVPPLLLGWGFFHIVLAAYKLGVIYLPRLWRKQ